MFRIMIKWLTIVVFSIMLAGFFFGTETPGYKGKLLPLGLFLFAFLWMPAFLFYAYDRRQQRKESTNSQEDAED
jgi:hypothetical protein